MLYEVITLFDRALRHLREFLFQPAVKALFALGLGDFDDLNTAHAKNPRAKAIPANSAASASTTEPIT